jgi:hypothetical protein
VTKARTVLPIDLVALVAGGGRVFPNAAVTRERIGTGGSQHPLGAALEQWFSFATGRHTWIGVKGATLRGLASARRRGSQAAWEIDCLIHDADDPDIVLNLLDRVTCDAGRAGAEKVFLRVWSTSPVLVQAVRAGFTAYLRERLLIRSGSGATGLRAGPSEGLRRWGRADAYGVFQLYNRWAPEPVRRLEAPTFREWQASRERISPPRATRQAVLECDGRLVGWLRTGIDGDVVRFDLMADPREAEAPDLLVAAALTRAAGRAEVHTLVPEFAAASRDRLRTLGFDDGGEFTVLVRRTVKPVRAARLAPAAPVQVFPA